MESILDLSKYFTMTFNAKYWISLIYEGFCSIRISPICERLGTNVIFTYVNYPKLIQIFHHDI